MWMRCPWTFRCSQAEAGVPALFQISKGLRIVILTPLTENKNWQSRKLFPPSRNALCKRFEECLNSWQQENLNSSPIHLNFYYLSYSNKGTPGLILISPRGNLGRGKELPRQNQNLVKMNDFRGRPQLVLPAGKTVSGTLPLSRLNFPIPTCLWLMLSLPIG